MAVSSGRNSFWKIDGEIVTIERVTALSVANFGRAKGKVVVALKIMNKSYSIFAEVLPDSSSITGYTLVSRTTYPSGRGNGKIFYLNSSNQELVPIQAIRISLHGDNRLTILGSGTLIESRGLSVSGISSNQIQIFTPISPDSNSIYRVEVTMVDKNDLLDSYTSDRTEPQPLNELSNILYTETDSKENQIQVTYNGQQMMAPDLPVEPPPGASEWSISSISLWSNNPPTNVSKPTFPILIQNRDQSPAPNVPKAWLYNVIDTSTGAQLQLQGHYPEGALVASSNGEIFLYTPTRCS